MFGLINSFGLIVVTCLTLFNLACSGSKVQDPFNQIKIDQSGDTKVFISEGDWAYMLGVCTNLSGEILHKLEPKKGTQTNIIVELQNDSHSTTVESPSFSAFSGNITMIINSENYGLRNNFYTHGTAFTQASSLFIESEDMDSLAELLSIEKCPVGLKLTRIELKRVEKQ